MGAGFKSLKIVILDEADFLSQNAQAGLRNMLESYSANTRFILTCNFPEKMIPAIVSRCQTYEIKPISKNEVAKKLMTILQSEGVAFTKEDIVFCVSTYYPDIRKIINFAQQSRSGDKLVIHKEHAVDTDALNKIVSLLQTPKDINTFNEIRKIAVDIDPNTIEIFYKGLFDKIDLFAKGKEEFVILELADAINNSASVIPPVRDITFIACIQRILKHLK
jgi:DNA polymerase III delta prime subunit